MVTSLSARRFSRADDSGCVAALGESDDQQSALIRCAGDYPAKFTNRILAAAVSLQQHKSKEATCKGQAIARLNFQPLCADFEDVDE